jgi:hypothetical protein
MVNSVLNTGIKFFEVNTNGRILNRFSKDMNMIDNLSLFFLEMVDVIIILVINNYIVQYKVFVYNNNSGNNMSIYSYICYTLILLH